MPCLDRPAPGTPAGASTGNASDRRPGGNAIAGNALGRQHGARIRPPSRPTARRRNASERHPRQRPRAPTPPAGCHTPPGWCRPTSACSPTPFRRQDRCDFSCYHGVKTIPIYRGGAADAQSVGPLTSAIPYERSFADVPRSEHMTYIAPARQICYIPSIYSPIR
jgi:hypothetical protein